MSDSADNPLAETEWSATLDTLAQAELSVVMASGQLRFDQGTALRAHANVDPYAVLALLRY